MRERSPQNGSVVGELTARDGLFYLLIAFYSVAIDVEWKVPFYIFSMSLLYLFT